MSALASATKIPRDNYITIYILLLNGKPVISVGSSWKDLQQDIELIRGRSQTPDGCTRKGRTEMATKKRGRISSERSSGNVFADLGLPNPEQEQLKARLTLQNLPHHQGAQAHPGAGREHHRHCPAAGIHAHAQPFRQFLRRAPDDLPDRPRPGR